MCQGPKRGNTSWTSTIIKRSIMHCTHFRFHITNQNIKDINALCGVNGACLNSVLNSKVPTTPLNMLLYSNDRHQCTLSICKPHGQNRVHENFR